MASNNKKKLEPVAPAANKQEALAKALGLIEKQYGKGAVMRLGENTGMAVDHISTGSLRLDCALGIAGLPRGEPLRPLALSLEHDAQRIALPAADRDRSAQQVALAARNMHELAALCLCADGGRVHREGI